MSVERTIPRRKFEKLLERLGFQKAGKSTGSHTHWKPEGAAELTTVSTKHYAKPNAFKDLEKSFGIPAAEFQKTAKLSNRDQNGDVGRLLVQCGRKAPTTTIIRRRQEAREEIEALPFEPVKRARNIHFG